MKSEHKKIHSALLKNGFIKDGDYYKKDAYKIRVYSDSTLDYIFKELIEFGKTTKIWEIKRTLEILD